MLEDLYSKVDLTKKVRFQTDDEEKNENISGKADNVVIFDNYCTEECTQPKMQDNTSEDQQQAVSVSQGSRKRNLLGAVYVLLGVLCLFFLVAVIILLFLWFQDKSNWNTERTQLWVDNQKVTCEKNQLQTSYDEMKRFNANLTQENKSLKAAQFNLTNEIYKLKMQIDPPCRANWIRIYKSCYLPSTSEKNWTESSAFCQNLGGRLMIISSTEKQMFASILQRRIWIGLTDVEKEGTWKWVSGQEVNKTYWKQGQPDDYSPGEDCAELSDGDPDSNWNDMPCSYKLRFICEITNEM